jgi:hypothetical protein
MPNGVAVLFDPSTAPAIAAAPTPAPVEVAIGEAVADAAVAVCRGVGEFRDGGAFWGNARGRGRDVSHALPAAGVNAGDARLRRRRPPGGQAHLVGTPRGDHADAAALLRGGARRRAR